MMEQILNFLIPTAHAETAAASASQSGGGLPLMVMMAGLVVFFYFTMWRPQSKRAKEQRDLMTSLNKGDEVVTVGGLLGKITKVQEQYVALSIANNIDVTLQKSAIAGVLPKGTLKTLE